MNWCQLIGNVAYDRVVRDEQLVNVRVIRNSAAKCDKIAVISVCVKQL